MNIKRGQLTWVDFKDGNGSCQYGTRPAVVIQNDTGNRFSTTTMVIPITSKSKNSLPVHTTLLQDYDVAKKGNVIMAEQLMVVNKSQIIFAGEILSEKDLISVERIISIQLALGKKTA